MSATGVGPAVAVEGPLPAAHAYNLTTVATPVGPVLDGEGVDLERWRNGISLLAYPDALPGGFDPCGSGTFRTKDDGNDNVIADFLPFTGYLPVHCTAFSVGSWAEFQARANAVLTVTEAYALELKLAQGLPITGTPAVGRYLADANLAKQAGGAVVSPQAGLAYLENAIGQTGRAGVLHATPAIAAAWSALGYAIERQGSGLRTVGNWTPIIVGTGYQGTIPVAGTSPSAGKEWAFATGPVVYGRSNQLIPVPETEREAVDREQNDVVYRAERDLLVAWDSILQAGALIDWTA